MMPGAGSVVAAIVAASGVEPVSIGKPGPLLLEVAAHALGRPVVALNKRFAMRHA